VLADWILEHQDDPYPTQAEKEALARRGGVSVKQVVDWMTNMRHKLRVIISKNKPSACMFVRLYRLSREEGYLRQGGYGICGSSLDPHDESDVVQTHSPMISR
jgi:Homeobox KN domain